MNITPAQRTITEYHLALSEADAREAVDSPYVFADRLAEQLRAVISPEQNRVAPSVNGDGKPRRKPKFESHIQVGRGRKATKASLRKAAHPNGKGTHPRLNRQGKGHSLEPVECPDCGQKIARKYLPTHRAKKHGVMSRAEIKAENVSAAG
jgi:hypothetical protein